MAGRWVIAVASGKGGTGKTTVATNLAKIHAGQGRTVQYLDCDVEEPNGHIFLKPRIDQREEITVDVPEVDAASLRKNRPARGSIVCRKRRSASAWVTSSSCT